jgi:transposase-like protein
MGSERGDEYKRLRPVGEGTGSKESEYSEAPQRATTSRLVPTHQQDHRAIKRRCVSMAGFKSFKNAATTIAGIEIAHRIRKGQFSFGRGRSRPGWSRKDECAFALA